MFDCRSDSISCGVKGPGAQEGAGFGFGEGAGGAAVEIVGLEEVMELRYAITGLRSRCDVPIPENCLAPNRRKRWRILDAF